MDQYSYEPLNDSGHEIRLLELQPGERDSIVQVNLELVSLDDNPIYEALSYTWGNSTVTTPLHIIEKDNSESRFVFEATSNLELALRHLRDPEKPRILWVDAICINQGDDNERSSQVQQMGRIFKSATRVCAWLGEDADSSLKVMEYLSRWSDGSRQIDELLEKEGRNDFFRAVVTFLRRPYFNRYWIVQELALASDIIMYSGEMSCGWESLVSLARPFMQAYVMTGGDLPDVRPGDFFLGVIGARQVSSLELARTSVGAISLRNLLRICNHRTTSELRDSIYSLLALGKDSNLLDWDIDYRKDLVDVLQDTVERIVLSSGSLDIICQGGLHPKHEHAHSWIPRFIRIMENCETLECSGSDPPTLTFSEVILQDKLGNPNSIILLDCSAYDAAAGTKVRVSFDKEKRQLTASGVVIDIVSQVLDCTDPYAVNYKIKIPEQWGKVALSIQHNKDSACRKGSRQETDCLKCSCRASNSEAFWRTLVANRRQLRLDEMSLPPGLGDEILSYNNGEVSRQLQSQAPDEWALEFEEWLRGDMTVDISDDNDSFRWHVFHYAETKRMVVTKTTIGMAPLATMQGDLICILMGCSVPVILRTVPSFPRLYRFVGEAYIHGMMDGEAIEILRKGEFELCDFTMV